MIRYVQSLVLLFMVFAGFAVPAQGPSQLADDSNSRTKVADSVQYDLSLPAATAFVDTLHGLHRNTATGNHSIFRLTNASVSSMSFLLDFYWPNGQPVGYDSGVLSPGATVDYEMEGAPFGEDPFYGFVQVSGDQTFLLEMLTSEFGAIEGTVYEENLTTPLQINSAFLYRYIDGEEVSNIYNMGDGKFFFGGLDVGERYVLLLHAIPPWISRWHGELDGQSMQEATPIVASDVIVVGLRRQQELFSDGYELRLLGRIISPTDFAVLTAVDDVSPDEPGFQVSTSFATSSLASQFVVTVQGGCNDAHLDCDAAKVHAEGPVPNPGGVNPDVSITLDLPGQTSNHRIGLEVEDLGGNTHFVDVRITVAL